MAVALPSPSRKRVRTPTAKKEPARNHQVRRIRRF
jgi:hypothetical protein